MLGSSILFLSLLALFLNCGLWIGEGSNRTLSSINDRKHVQACSKTADCEFFAIGGKTADTGAVIEREQPNSKAQLFLVLISVELFVELVHG